MADQDRERWNRKYREPRGENDPSEIVRLFSRMAPVKRAMDIAAGEGRNALYLAEQGFQVDAVDISDVAMDRLKGRHPRLTALRRDLDTYQIPAGRYGLIANIRYLNRRLFPAIIEGLVPGGVLIFETYLIEAEGEDAGPIHCRDYLLRENELLHSFLRMRIIHYSESRDAPSGGQAPERTAALVGIRQL